ncbi:hypothetical protein COU59_01505 [Candidatus Pacearchaeota archaeon CG10_big_fil_rev_8_21_14_0_10_34_12]|nr:MAG: hypothetical protein COU59_01505 [Candidatus Pacearchaeota archaeon CG10_big_fil_rev_8_21_14_0_10_34_12]
MAENLIEIFSKEDFRKWLKKNHLKETHVLVVLHKKHTGKNKTSAAELMKEAICFGWIDATVKRLDEDRWGINYRKRTKNSTWSYNTLRYAKELAEKGLMSREGMKWYEEGKKKLPHDHGIPKNPEVPEEMEKIFVKNKKAKENFENLAPSTRRTYLRWIFRAKLPETKSKRINEVVRKMSNGELKKITLLKVSS